eukprot:3927379-Amphidinium_carterae.2
MSGRHSLQKYAAPSCIHVQSCVNSFVAFAAIQKDACLRFSSSSGPLSLKGKVESLASTPPGGASGSAAAAVAAESRVLGDQHVTGGLSGSTDDPHAGELGQPTPRHIWPIFWFFSRAPD